MPVQVDDVGSDLPDQARELPRVGEKRPLGRQRDRMKLDTLGPQLRGQLPLTAADDDRSELGLGAKDKQPDADRPAADR